MGGTTWPGTPDPAAVVLPVLAGDDDRAAPDALAAGHFAPLTEADRARAVAIPAGSGGGASDAADHLELRLWPEQNPPASRFKHWEHGEPSRVWVYRAADGNPVMAAARYDFARTDGTPDKDGQPWTFGRRVWTDRKGKPRDITDWHCKAPPSPRPLYRLERLAARPDAPVLVCEGEKAADAAGLLFPDCVAITSQGGSKAPGKSDWAPLQGRAVTIWPDQDEPGAAYAATVAGLAKMAGAASVRTVEVPSDWPQGWDLADPLPDGVAPDRPRELLDNAPDGAAPEVPAGYRMAPTWPAPALELASAETLPPPDLPLQDVFPAGWAAWIEAAAESKGAPADYVALGLLSAAGALIGNARWANPWDGWAEPPAINAALIGNPSAGKSPALDALVSPLADIEAGDNEDWKDRKREHVTEQTAAALRKDSWEKEVKEAVKIGTPPPFMPSDAAEPDPIQKRRILSTDPTVAKAERMSAGNPRGLALVRDELAGWIAGMDRYNGGAGSDRAFWLQAYGGRLWSPDRVKDGDAEISVAHLTWSIVGGIQPDRLASLMMAGDDDGLAARFLYTWPAQQRPKRPRDGLSVACAEEWLGRLRRLPWTPPVPLLVPFDRAAQTALQEWREEVARMEEGSAGLFLSWLGKLPGFAVRLSLIFAHLAWSEHGRGDPPGEVTEADMLRALTFLSDYAVPMARRCFGEAGLPEAERDARRLARWLLRRQPIPAALNVRELRRMQEGPGIATPDRIKAALEELAGLGWVRAADPNRAGIGGRSRNDWTVNPELAGGAHGVA
jgi:hypothetical protein